MQKRLYNGQKAVYYWLMFFGIMLIIISIVFISVAIFSEPDALEQCSTDYVGEVSVDCSVYEKIVIVAAVPIMAVGLIQFVAIYYTILWGLEFWKRKTLADCIGDHAANLYVDLSRDIRLLKSDKYDNQTKEIIFRKIVSSLSGISHHITREDGHFLDLGEAVMEDDNPRNRVMDMYDFVTGIVEPILTEHKGKIREEKAAIRKAELELALANKKLKIQQQQVVQQNQTQVVQQNQTQKPQEKSSSVLGMAARGFGRLVVADYNRVQSFQNNNVYKCWNCKQLKTFSHPRPGVKCCGKTMVRQH